MEQYKTGYLGDLRATVDLVGEMAEIAADIARDTEQDTRLRLVACATSARAASSVVPLIRLHFDLETEALRLADHVLTPDADRDAPSFAARRQLALSAMAAQPKTSPEPAPVAALMQDW